MDHASSDESDALLLHKSTLELKKVVQEEKDETPRHLLPPIMSTQSEPLRGSLASFKDLNFPRKPEYQLYKIMGIPLTAAKTRVENHVKFSLRLTHPINQQGWKYLRIPEQFLPLKKQFYMESDEKETLRLDISLFRASDGERVEICSSCSDREMRRTKEIVKHPMRLSTDSLLSFFTGEQQLAMRFLCYCSHHNERVGFQFAISLYDWEGNLVAQDISPPIMVTDDHKKVSKELQKKEIQATKKKKMEEEEESSKSLPNLVRVLDEATSSSSHLMDTVLERIVPKRGSISGDNRICILGNNLHSDIKVFFGSFPASLESVWSHTCMIVIPPISFTPQRVKVTLRDPNTLQELPSSHSLYFTYFDEHDTVEYEKALQVACFKLTGRILNPMLIANSIINNKKVDL